MIIITFSRFNSRTIWACWWHSFRLREGNRSLYRSLKANKHKWRSRQLLENVLQQAQEAQQSFATIWNTKSVLFMEILGQDWYVSSPFIRHLWIWFYILHFQIDHNRTIFWTGKTDTPLVHLWDICEFDLTFYIFKLTTIAPYCKQRRLRRLLSNFELYLDCWATCAHCTNLWPCNARIEPCRKTVHLRLTHLCRPVRSTFAVRDTASLGIMGAPRVPPLNPPETIVLSEHYRLWGV